MSVAVRSIAAVLALFPVSACMSDESGQANRERRLARARESLARGGAGRERARRRYQSASRAARSRWDSVSPK